MRKLLRAMAKAQLEKSGANKINRRLGYGRWRQLVGAYPINTATGIRMYKGYHGLKKRHGRRYDYLFFYNWRFLPALRK